jgi:hypothetical protein
LPGSSFLASHDRRIVFGLGSDPGPDALTIRWPSGRTQQAAALAPNRYHHLMEDKP